MGNTDLFFEASDMQPVEVDQEPMTAVCPRRSPDPSDVTLRLIDHELYLGASVVDN